MSAVSTKVYMVGVAYASLTDSSDKHEKTYVSRAISKDNARWNALQQFHAEMGTAWDVCFISVSELVA